MVTRDFCTEMAEVIAQATAVGPYVPRRVATDIVDKLSTTDPELLHGWLHAQAERLVWQVINDRDRSIRSATRHRIRPAAFGLAAQAHEHGDPAPLRKFLDMRFTVADGTRRPLASLHQGDLMFVADGYRRRAEQNALMNRVLTAMAKKIGADTVAEHYTESQLSAMFDSAYAA